MTPIISKSGRCKAVRRLYHRDVPADNDAEIHGAKMNNRDPERRRVTVPVAVRSTSMKLWARSYVSDVQAEEHMIRSWLEGK